MSRTHQTLRFLTRRFSAAGLTPDPRKGQNFLIDQNLLRILADEAQLTPQDLILEIGTGTGALTALLAERCGQVLTVEIDLRLQQLAREHLGEFSNIQFISGDILKNKNKLQPSIMQAVSVALRDQPDWQYKLVANLPYNIATPLISNLLLEPQVPDLMVVTIQKELADRMTASPRTKDYSALSVWVQSFCECEVVRTLGPSVFWPRPKVHSAILKIRPDKTAIAKHDRLVEYHQFVRSVFLLRRKFLRSVLVSVLKPTHSKTAVDAALAELGWGPQTRAEELTVEEFRHLFRALQAHAGPSRE